MILSAKSAQRLSFLEEENSRCIKGIAAVCFMLAHYRSSLSILTALNGFPWLAIFFFYSGYGLKQGLVRKPNYLNHFLGKKILKYIFLFFSQKVHIHSA